MMGVLPLQFPEGQDAESLGLTGEETFSITGVTAMNDGPTPKTVKVKAGDVEFDAVVRIDTPGEANYYCNAGIMQAVLTNLQKAQSTPRRKPAPSPVSGLVPSVDTSVPPLHGIRLCR